MMKSLRSLLVIVLFGIMAVPGNPASAEGPPPDVPPPAAAQPAAAPPAAVQPAAPAAPAANAFSAEQLEQMVSPIALYPDALAMQILMATTYPLEVVEAERWVKKYPNLKSDELDKALREKSWDPSVKSLAHFPDVLTRMSENLDWTRDMGDAFLAQQKEVLDAIQRMRQKAYDLGNLKSTPEQKVTVEPAPPSAEAQTVVVQQAPPQIIKIEPAQPEVVYVPAYSPAVVYGPPPATVYYPAMYAYPPGYVATASLVSFGVGMAVGAALWSDCDWGHHDVNINNTYNYNRSSNVSNIDANRQRPEQWKHNPEHRKGVNYRNDAVAKQYGQRSDRAGRDSARGFQRPGGAQQRPASVASARPARGSSGPGTSLGSRPQPSTRERAGQPSAGSRAGAERPAAAARPPSASRPASQNRPVAQNTAFGGMESGRAERAASARGASSRGVDRGSFARDTGGYSGRGGGGYGGRGGGGYGGGGGRGGGRGRR